MTRIYIDFCGRISVHLATFVVSGSSRHGITAAKTDQPIGKFSSQFGMRQDLYLRKEAKQGISFPTRDLWYVLSVKM